MTFCSQQVQASSSIQPSTRATKLQNHRRLRFEIVKMADDYKFEGWVIENGTNGQMVWKEFQPKAWEETDIDIQVRLRMKFVSFSLCYRTNNATGYTLRHLWHRSAHTEKRLGMNGPR